MWEVAHGPAYIETDVPLAERIPHCAPMALTDTVWAGLIVVVVAGLLREQRHIPAIMFTVTALAGAATAVAFEAWAIATDRWTYNERMVVVPIIGVGLWPVLQMTVLPPAALWLSTRAVRASWGRRRSITI